VFAEIDAFGAAAGREFPKVMPERSVCADHWYDSTTLYLKTFDANNAYDFATGERATSPEQILERFKRQIGFRAEPAKHFPGGQAPSLIGEFGIPYDLDEGEAFQAWAAGRRDPAIWSKHTQALELMYDALDALQLHSTQWNYTASNRNDLRIGDGWNQEDLSIFSRDQQDDSTDPDSGGRALAGFCRPFAQAIQGRLGRVRFARAEGLFELDYEADPTVAADTLVYMPRLQFPDGFEVALDGAERMPSDDPQILRLRARARGPVRLTVRRR
jgi:hypothetical protein